VVYCGVTSRCVIAFTGAYLLLAFLHACTGGRMEKARLATTENPGDVGNMRSVAQMTNTKACAPSRGDQRRFDSHRYSSGSRMAALAEGMGEFLVGQAAVSVRSLALLPPVMMFHFQSADKPSLDGVPFLRLIIVAALLATIWSGFA